MKLFPVGTLTVRVSFTGIQVNHHIPSPGYTTNFADSDQFWSGFTYDSESLQNSLEEVQGRTFIPTFIQLTMSPKKEWQSEIPGEHQLHWMTEQKQSLPSMYQRCILGHKEEEAYMASPSLPRTPTEYECESILTWVGMTRNGKEGKHRE